MDNRANSGQDMQKILSQARRESAKAEVIARISKINSEKLNGRTEYHPDGNPHSLDNMTAAAALKSNDPEAQQFREYLTSLIDKRETDSSMPDAALEQELRSLRRELDRAQRALKRADIHDFPYPFGGVHQKLVNSGLSKSHAAMLVRRAQSHLSDEHMVGERHAFHIIQSEISTLFQGYQTYVKKPKEGPRVTVLMGPTGVGKTTTIMKLASKPGLMGAKRVAIISTDCYRMAASSELEVFSQITTIPFHKTSNLEELEKVMATLQEYDLILVDTPARSPSFHGYIQEMQNYFNVLNPTDILLTLSMATDLDDLFMSTGLFMALKPTGLIYSKLDETCRQGKMVTLAAEIGLPIAFVCDGQKIPETIHIPNGIYIWDKLINALDN
ncbi:MAG: hypothetical protein U9Q77_01375 [Candidatus Marinimicrobia bacterium]|nr:hypothetical protein [Candidatus Neomarinimicrobiota bacterium]